MYKHHKNRIDLVVTIGDCSSIIRVPVLRDGSIMLSPKQTQRLGLKPGDSFTLDPTDKKAIELDSLAR